jgi:AcrR family transcriptional regulator
MTKAPDQQPEARPAEQRPVEERPAEQRPAEQRPAEQRPAEERPAEERPAEQRPAEQLRSDARQNRARLITAATQAFAEKGADAPLEDIARRAGVGIGTLYRHFPSRLDLQAAVFRTGVRDICNKGEALSHGDSPERAFADWTRALAAYLVTKRGLSRTLIDSVGIESELITSCWTIMRETTDRLLADAQRAGVIRPDVTAVDVMRLVHGVAVSSEKDPERTNHLLSITLDGLTSMPH